MVGGFLLVPFPMGGHTTGVKSCSGYFNTGSLSPYSGGTNEEILSLAGSKLNLTSEGAGWYSGAINTPLAMINWPCPLVLIIGIGISSIIRLSIFTHIIQVG